MGTILVIGAGRANDVPNEIVELTGVPLNSTDLGTFAGTTIADNETIKGAIQDLEDAVETKIGDAPADSNDYVRNNNAWVTASYGTGSSLPDASADSGKVLASGGTEWAGADISTLLTGGNTGSTLLFNFEGSGDSQVLTSTGMTSTYPSTDAKFGSGGATFLRSNADFLQGTWPTVIGTQLFTFSFWIKTSDTDYGVNTSKRIIAPVSGTNLAGGFQIMREPAGGSTYTPHADNAQGAICLLPEGNLASYHVSTRTNDVADGAWHYVVFQHEGSGVYSCFFDGNLTERRNLGTATDFGENGGFFFGKREDNNADAYLTGSLDNIVLELGSILTTGSTVSVPTSPVGEVIDNGLGGTLGDLTNVETSDFAAASIYRFGTLPSYTGGRVVLNPNVDSAYLYAGLSSWDNGNVSLVGGTSSTARAVMSLHSTEEVYFHPDIVTNGAIPPDWTIKIEVDGTTGERVQYRTQPLLGTGTTDLVVPTMGQVRTSLAAIGVADLSDLGTSTGTTHNGNPSEHIDLQDFEGFVWDPKWNANGLNAFIIYNSDIGGLIVGNASTAGNNNRIYIGEDFYSVRAGVGGNVVSFSYQNGYNTSAIADTQTEIRLYSGGDPYNGGNYTALRSALNPSGSVTLTFPGTAGTNGQVLTTDGTGVLSWTTGGGGGGAVNSVNTLTGDVSLGVLDLDDVTQVTVLERVYDTVNEAAVGGFNFGGGFFQLNKTDANSVSLSTSDFVGGTIWITTNNDPVLAVPYSSVTDGGSFIQFAYDDVTYVFTKTAPCVVSFADPATATPQDGQALIYVDANSQWEPQDVANSVNTQTGVVSLGVVDMDDFALAPVATREFLLTGPGSLNPSVSGEFYLLGNTFAWVKGDPVDAFMLTLGIGDEIEFITEANFSHTAEISLAPTTNSQTSNYCQFVNNLPTEVTNAYTNNESITVKEVGTGNDPLSEGQVLTYSTTRSKWENIDPRLDSLDNVDDVQYDRSYSDWEWSNYVGGEGSVVNDGDWFTYTNAIFVAPNDDSSVEARTTLLALPASGVLYFSQDSGGTWSPIAYTSIVDFTTRVRINCDVSGEGIVSTSPLSLATSDPTGAVPNEPSDGQVLIYDATVDSKWKPSRINFRTTESVTTASIADAASDNVTVTNVGYSGQFISITTDRAAWVTVYSDTTSRTNDAARAETTDPSPGSGVLAEVITTGAQTVRITPAAGYFNDEGTPASELYLKVVNKSGATSTVQVDLKVVVLENYI